MPKVRRVRITQGSWTNELGTVLATYPNEARTTFPYYYLLTLDNEPAPMAFIHDEVEELSTEH